MAETIGSIQVVASINTKSYDDGKKHIEKGNKDLQDSSDKSADNISGKWGSAFKAVGAAAAIGFAAASAATVSLVSSAVKGYAEYQQLTGGVETLFKNSSDVVIGYAENAFKTAGLSANDYMSTVTSFTASLLQGLNGDTAKAAKIADTAITDMADNANKLGTSMELIQNAYQGFAKDNFTMLDNLKLGYGGTASEMARLVNESGVLGKSFKATAENVSEVPFDKLIEAIHVVQTEMGITGTTAMEAASTISGSADSMAASWENLVGGLADPNADFDKLLDNFITSAKTFGGNLIPAITKALSGVVDLVAGLAPVLIAELPKLIDTLLPPLVDTAVNLFVQLVNLLPKVLPTLINGFVRLISALAQRLPEIFTSLLTALLAAFDTIIKALYDPAFIKTMFNAAIQLFMAIVNALPQVITALIAALPTVISSLIAFMLDPNTILQLTKAAVILFGAIVTALPLILSALFKAFADLLSQLWTKLQNNFTQFGAKFGEGIGAAIKGGINSVLGWIERQLNMIIDNINGAMKSIDEILPGDQSGLKVPRLKIPMLANGGVATAPTLAMIGEGKEDEAVLPLSKLDAMLRNAGSEKGGDTYKITVNASADMIRSENDKREFAKMIIDSLNQTRKSKGLPAIG